MKSYQRIAIANVAWSELYEGDALVGDHAFLQKNGWGAERYNFLPVPDGGYAGYVRPVGPTDAVPNPREKDGWLVIYVSKRKNRPGLYIVGWFENATFLPDYRDRPEYEIGDEFPLTPDNTKFHYVAVAKNAFRVPEELRDVKIETTAMRRTSIMYLRGHGTFSAKKEALAQSVVRQIDELRELIGNVGFQDNTDKRNSITTDSNRRKEVEDASMDCATDYLKGLGYSVKDVSADKIGYDLLGTKKSATSKHPKQLFVEVKGTQADRPRFLMSRRERLFMDDPINETRWRLLIVTSALKKPKPLALNRSEVNSRFDLSTFTWFGEEKR
jgi:hypothetical protein